MLLDGDIECGLGSTTKPSSQFPVQADVKTDSRCTNAKLLSSFHSQLCSSTIKMITAHKAKLQNVLKSVLLKTLTFCQSHCQEITPITTTKLESFTQKTASKEFLSCCLWNSLVVANPWTKNGSVC